VSYRLCNDNQILKEWILIVTRNFGFYTENTKFSNHSLRMAQGRRQPGGLCSSGGSENSAEFAIKEKIKAIELGDASEQ